MMWAFYFFAAVLVWQGIMSLRGGVRYLAYVRRELDLLRPGFAPFASVIAPCRGLDQGLRDNLAALFRQRYPAYEIIFVADSADDPALKVVEELRLESQVRNGPTEVLDSPTEIGSGPTQVQIGPGQVQTGPASRVVIAGPARTSGQKVHNLLAAVREVAATSEVLVFVDTDARPRDEWLRALVAPLVDEGIGVATGYRWFIPERGGFSSRLRSEWNASIASALGADSRKNFCWGGSTAIRRSTFERLKMTERWQGTLSDDFSLMRALRGAQLPIHFVPACLVASHEDCSFAELLEFTTRQLKITRVYASEFWKAVLAGSLIFVTGFFGGLALVMTRAALGLSFLLPLALLLFIFLLGAMKSYLRLRAVELMLKAEHASLRRASLAHLLLWPFAAALYLYNSLAAAFSRRIEWRGITYELKSPDETVIVSGPASSTSLFIEDHR